MSEDTKPPLPNAYRIDISQTAFQPGPQAQLWGGEYPGKPDPPLLRRRLRSFLDSNITYFINLTEEMERSDHYQTPLHELAQERGVDVDHKRFAVEDYNVPPAPLMDQILDDIDQALHGGRSVYVHCWGGIGRTGTVIGCWLVRHGLSGSEALDKIALWRDGIPAADLPSPETDQQRQMVLTWSDNR